MHLTRLSRKGRAAVAAVAVAAITAACGTPARAAVPSGGLLAFGSNHYGQLGNATNNGGTPQTPRP